MKVILIPAAAAVLYEAAVMIRCYRAAYRNYVTKPVNSYRKLCLKDGKSFAMRGSDYCKVHAGIVPKLAQN